MYELSIIQFPTGRYGFVGSVPYSLGSEVKATRNDVMAGKAFNTIEGLMVIKFPSFETREEAIEYALEKGYKLDG